MASCMNANQAVIKANWHGKLCLINTRLPLIQPTLSSIQRDLAGIVTK